MTVATETAWVHSIEFKSISRENSEHPVNLTTLRVRVDRSFRQGENADGSPKWNRERDFWTDVQVWGTRSLPLKDVVGKGAAILMTGRYDVSVWEDDAGGKHTRVVFRATHVAILPRCISSISYRTRDSGGQDWGEQTEQAGAGAGEAWPGEFQDNGPPF